MIATNSEIEVWAHLATIGCNEQEILRVHLAAIGCDGLMWCHNWGPWWSAKMYWHILKSCDAMVLCAILQLHNMYYIWVLYKTRDADEHMEYWIWWIDWSFLKKHQHFFHITTEVILTPADIPGADLSEPYDRYQVWVVLVLKTKTYRKLLS